MAVIDNTPALKPGDTFGDYTVERLLGKGGMGMVYLMRATSGELFAVKVMHRGVMSHSMRVRFVREADFAMKIRHKNLISVYDVGEDPDTGLCYIIMDYVPGGTLADLIRERGAIPVREAVRIMMHVAAALDVAHRNGLVHRDVKPDNIMFAADGTPKLADLGVAKFGDERNTMVTMAGMMIGTPAYMSPEQLIDSHKIDARSDIYSLGVILYEMISGKRPNSGSTAVELLAKAMRGESLPDIRTICPNTPASVANALSQMCAPAREDRPATAMDAMRLLQKVATGRLILPKKSTRAAIAERLRRRLIAIVAALVAVGLVSLFYYMFVQAPMWVSAPRDNDPQPSELLSDTNDVQFAAESETVPAEPQPVVVTQLVETVREVLKTIVVTASEVSVQSEVKQQGDMAAEVDEVSPKPAPAIAAAPEKDINVEVCGIRLECAHYMTNELRRIVSCIKLANVEVRRILHFKANARVQSSVDIIRLVKSCENRDGWSRDGKTLEVGLAVLSNDEKLESLVSNFMTSYRDRRAVEPFEKEFYKYIRYKVWDGIAVARERVFNGGVLNAQIEKPLAFRMSVIRKYGRNDYNGQLKRYGALRQVVPPNMVSRNREGQVFWLLNTAESFKKDALRLYFMEKEQAIKQRKLPHAISASDFVALMSNAIGRDLFPLLADCGWNLNSFTANVKVRFVPKAELFGD